jgi:hypothetical protein
MERRFDLFGNRTRSFSPQSSALQARRSDIYREFYPNKYYLFLVSCNLLNRNDDVKTYLQFCIYANRRTPPPPHHQFCLLIPCATTSRSRVLAELSAQNYSGRANSLSVISDSAVFSLPQRSPLPQQRSSTSPIAQLDRPPIIAYFIIGSPKEGYLSRVGKVKPTLLTFPPISHPPSGPRWAIW